MAPEVLRNEEYDTKVDVFSFSLILQEVNLCLLAHCNIYIYIKLVLYECMF